MQADPDDEEVLKTENAEASGGACDFEEKLTKMRLQPIAFLSRT